MAPGGHAVTDLKIDFDTLKESSSALEDIYHAFDTIKSRASATESDWGSDDIKGAMGSFSGDWDSHRKKIMESLEKTKQMVDQTIAGFNDTEGKLAGSLHQQTTTGTERAE
jgi:hypothetical protein